MDLQALLTKAFCDTFVFYVRTHGFHWNVTGEDFYEYHVLFERIYEEVYGAVDDFGEHLRAEDMVAPESIFELADGSDISGSIFVTNGNDMAKELYMANEMLIDSLNAAIAAAEANNRQGLINFLGSRLDAHGKHRWMLKQSMMRNSANM